MDVPNDLESTLIDLEQRMLDADAAYDAAFFRSHCADDLLVVGAHGVIPKAQVVQMYEAGEANPDRRSKVQDPRVLPLGDHGAAVIYTLVSSMPEGTSSWYATTVYRRTPGGWRIAVLHQTPQPS